MKRLLFFVILFCTYYGHAQNYQCLQSGVRHYFINDIGYLRGIRIDSVIASGSDVIFYPFHTPRGNYAANPDLDSTGGSWLGKKVIQQTDGTTLFENIWSDTVVIKPQAHLGDSWIFYNDTTPLYYEANVTGVDTMTVLGSVDSIKKIMITAHNGSGIVTTDPADSFQITLSRNHGFVQVFDLYTFPYHAPDTAFTTGYDFYLDYLAPTSALISVNSSFSLIQLLNPTYEQLYKWNIGDIYEYSTCDGYFEHFGASCYPAEHYVTDTITAISSAPGGVSYSYNGCISTYVSPWPVSVLTFPSGPFMYSNSYRSGTLTYDTTLLIDTMLMPEEFHQTNIYYYFLNDTTYCTTNPKYEVQLNYEIREARYIAPFEAYAGPSVYKAPLGLLNADNAFQDVGAIVHSQKLIYYNRGGTLCGSLLIPPASVSNVELLGNIQVFPNPARDALIISSPDEITTVSISNLLGQIIYTLHCSSQKVQVEVADMPAGIYFVKINSTEVRKFVKE